MEVSITIKCINVPEVVKEEAVLSSFLNPQGTEELCDSISKLICKIFEFGSDV